VALLRQGEPWFEPAYAAFQAIVAGKGGAAEWAAMTPFSYGRWDAAAQAHDAAQEAAEVNDEAAARYGEDGVYEPTETNPALRRLNFPVLVIAGEWDMNTPPAVAAEIAGLFAHAELVVQAGAGHYPWVDDARTFVSATVEFLGEAVV
jgi:pimeloyl-ACP methyl ester carboxylesterase